MASVDKIERELEYVKTQYGRCVEELKEKGEKLGEKEVELHDLKKNLRQRKYEDESEKNWWLEDMQKLEEEVKELKVEKNELKVEKDEWKVQMQKLQNTLMETTKTGNSGVGKWSRIKKYFLIHPITIILRPFD
ncbi:hypothetical protein G9A89_023104 [Geosiphon pyriformis]|nr:hypothetical protein G9A89_023104 [Geosiphon pyriformis]